MKTMWFVILADRQNPTAEVRWGLLESVEIEYGD